MPIIFLSLLFFALISSCASLQSIPEAKQTRVIGGVPFFAQEEYQCGPASLAGVMNYLGVSVTPDDIAKEIYSKSLRGTLNIDMALYPQKKGLTAQQYQGSMDDLRKKIDSGNPVIVFVDNGFWFVQAGHFMVVVGYNEFGVIVNSGKEKQKFISEKDFMSAWQKTKFWTLLIKKK